MNNIINSKLIIEFTPNTEPVPFNVNTNSLVSSWFHDVVGRNNDIHGKPSEFSISDLQGSKISEDKKSLNFKYGAYVVFSTLNMDLIIKIMCNWSNIPYLGYGMKCIGITPQKIETHPRYDIVRSISPILLIHNKENITVNNPLFLEKLIENTRRKLKHHLNDDDMIGFDIELIKPEKAKVKRVRLGKVKHETSSVVLKVTGSEKLRRILYIIGMGKSTGYGFGCLSIYKN